MKPILLILFMIISNLAIGQKTDTGSKFIDAINAVSDEERISLLREIFSEDALVNPGEGAILSLIQRLHQNFAPSSYHHSETMKGFSGTVMHIYARKEGAVMFTDYQFYLDAGMKLNKIAFIAEVAEPVNLPNSAIDQKYTLDWLNNYSDKLGIENDLYGSYYISKGNNVLFDRQMGFEDTAKTRPVSKNSLFNIASGGKMFTAIAIAQLVEAGKISFDDPVTKYLDGFQDKTKASRIKISNLLSHTSGVNEYWSGQTDKAVLLATSINEHLILVYGVGLGPEAGSEYRYCNSNFILLGAIIEKVTGVSYYDYVSKNIFNRSGMNTAGYFRHGSKIVAQGLARSGNNGWKEGRHGMLGSSAGGAYCTQYDIIAFSNALKGNALIRRETFNELISVKNANLKRSEDYGYGFILSNLGEEFGYGHGGTSDGVNFEFIYYPDQDVTLILFCNQNNGAYDDLKKNIIKLITGYR